MILTFVKSMTGCTSIPSGSTRTTATGRPCEPPPPPAPRPRSRFGAFLSAAFGSEAKASSALSGGGC